MIFCLYGKENILQAWRLAAQIKKILLVTSTAASTNRYLQKLLATIASTKDSASKLCSLI